MANQGGGLKGAGGWLVLLAVAAGMLYALYVVRWSGDLVADIPLEAPGVTEYESFELDPDMSPVRATLDMSLLARRGRAFKYSAMIHGQEGRVKAVFEKSGDYSFDSDSDDNRRRQRGVDINLGAFDVPAESNYGARVSVTPRRRAEIKSARLVLKANAATFDARIIGGLVAALVLGFILGVLGKGRASGSD